jgi:4'-phosphopantetheinyl transferase
MNMDSIKFYFIKNIFDKIPNCEILNKNLPNHFWDRYNGYLHEKDKNAFYLGRYLLMKALIDLNYEPVLLKKMNFTKFGKPYFNTDLNFSISHSGDYIGLVMHKNLKVGLDIEKIKAIPYMEYKGILNLTEKKHLNYTKKMADFYNIWTKKEAFSKAIGMGLYISFETLNVVSNSFNYQGQEWFFMKLNVDKAYSVHISTEKDNVPVETKEVKI